MTRAEMDRLLEGLSDVELEDLENGIARAREARQKQALRAIQASWQLAGAR